MHVVKIDKNYLNAPILSRFKGCGYKSRANFNSAGTVFIHQIAFPFKRQFHDVPEDDIVGGKWPIIGWPCEPGRDAV